MDAKKKSDPKKKPTKKITPKPENQTVSKKILKDELHNVRTELQISLLKWKISSMKKKPEVEF